MDSFSFRLGAFMKTYLRYSYGSWKIDVLLSDTYNFEYWDETHGNTLSRFIHNNFGFNFQRSHRLTPYVWIINFVYYEEYTIRYIPVWW